VNEQKIQIVRGDVILVDLAGTKGAEKRGNRPCVVVQNNEGNEKAPYTIIIPLTKAEEKDIYPFQVFVEKGDGGAKFDSIACCESLRLVDKSRILDNLGHLSEDTMRLIDDGLKDVLELY